MKKKRALELFAGLRGWTSAREDSDEWELITTDIDTKFDVTFHADVMDLTASDLIAEYGHFDAVLASPPCEKFSVSSLSKYWWVVDDCHNCGERVRLMKKTHGKGSTTTWEHLGEGCDEPRATVKHEPDIEPKNDEALLFAGFVEQTLKLIEGLAPAYWVMENPTGMMRRLPILKNDPTIDLRPISYCRYGMTYMKPTDLWGGFPPSLELHPVCKTRPNKNNPLQGQQVEMPNGWIYVTDENGEPCHEAASRGARTGIQRISSYAEKSLVPTPLSDAFFTAVERDLAPKKRIVRRKARA